MGSRSLADLLQKMRATECCLDAGRDNKGDHYGTGPVMVLRNMGRLRNPVRLASEFYYHSSACSTTYTAYLAQCTAPNEKKAIGQQNNRATSTSPVPLTTSYLPNVR